MSLVNFLRNHMLYFLKVLFKMCLNVCRFDNIFINILSYKVSTNFVVLSYKFDEGLASDTFNDDLR